MQLEIKKNFYPNHWVKTYNHWMDNIQDWCIQTTLLGHQIPVGSKKDADRSNQDNWFVSTTPPTDLDIGSRIMMF